MSNQLNRYLESTSYSTIAVGIYDLEDYATISSDMENITFEHRQAMRDRIKQGGRVYIKFFKGDPGGWLWSARKKFNSPEVSVEEIYDVKLDQCCSFQGHPLYCKHV